MIVSVSTALQGRDSAALGNIVGSNICNIALILGIASLVKPLKVNLKVIRVDVTILIGVSSLLILMLLDGTLSRFEGTVLALGSVAYTYFTVKLAKKNSKIELTEESIKTLRSKWLDIVFVIGGIIVLVVGASLFVNGASTIAKFMGIPDAVIGLTVLAVGTSLPELATSIVAAYKGEGDISIGNVIGSNIFNILSILGIVAIIHPIVIGEISMSGAFSPVDLGMMLFVALVIGPLARTQLVISRLEGLFLLSIYVGYLFYLYTKMAV